MIKNIRHTGIAVRDLDKMVDFYCRLLGFKITTKTKEDKNFINKIYGSKKIELTTVKISAPDGNLIELLYYHNHTKGNKLKKFTDIGITHLAFTVENIDDEYDRLSKEKIIFNSLPQTSPNGYAKVAFCKDPEGNFIELVEVLEKQL